MGMHFIFGAFLFGLVMPRDERNQPQGSRWEGTARVGNVLLLPVHLVVAGMNVDLSGIDAVGLGELGLILLASVGGKVAGTVLAARAHRIRWRQAAVLGTLMNTRGLTELIVLTVGLQLGLLDRGLYSLLVLMALITTAMTGPALQLLGEPASGDQLRDAAPEPTADTADSTSPGPTSAGTGRRARSTGGS